MCSVTTRTRSHGVLKYVACFCKIYDGVCLVTSLAVGARVWEVWLFRHADVVCLCIVCITWQFTILHSA